MDFELRAVTDKLRDDIHEKWDKITIGVVNKVIEGQLQIFEDDTIRLYSDKYDNKYKYDVKWIIGNVRALLENILEIERTRTLNSQLKIGEAKFIFPIKDRVVKYEDDLFRYLNEQYQTLYKQVSASDNEDVLSVQIEGLLRKCESHLIEEVDIESAGFKEFAHIIFGKDVLRGAIHDLNKVEADIKNAIIEYLLKKQAPRLIDQVFKVDEIRLRILSDSLLEDNSILDIDDRRLFEQNIKDLVKRVKLEFHVSFLKSTNADSNQLLDKLMPEAFAAVRRHPGARSN